MTKKTNKDFQNASSNLTCFFGCRWCCCRGCCVWFEVWGLRLLICGSWFILNKVELYGPILGPCWTVLARLGGMLDHFAAMLAHLWGHVGPFWGYVGGFIGSSWRCDGLSWEPHIGSYYVNFFQIPLRKF